MKIELLQDHPEFIDELNGLFFNEWHHFYPGSKLSGWKSGLLTRVNEKIIPTTLVAFNDDVTFGSAAIVVNDMKTRLELSPWLAGVFVKKEYRNKGIGKALINEIENLAKELNVKMLYLFTENKSEYYKKLKWEIKEQTVYQNIAVTIMQKKLLVADLQSAGKACTP